MSGPWRVRQADGDPRPRHDRPAAGRAVPSAAGPLDALPGVLPGAVQGLFGAQFLAGRRTERSAGRLLRRAGLPAQGRARCGRPRASALLARGAQHLLDAGVVRRLCRCQCAAAARRVRGHDRCLSDHRGSARGRSTAAGLWSGQLHPDRLPGGQRAAGRGAGQQHRHGPGLPVLVCAWHTCRPLFRSFPRRS